MSLSTLSLYRSPLPMHQLHTYTSKWVLHLNLISSIISLFLWFTSTQKLCHSFFFSSSSAFHLYILYFLSLTLSIHCIYTLHTLYKQCPLIFFPQLVKSLPSLISRKSASSLYFIINTCFDMAIASPILVSIMKNITALINLFFMQQSSTTTTTDSGTFNQNSLHISSLI